MSKLEQAAGEYAASIRSEAFAVGRNKTELFIDGVLASLGFEAGVHWARGELLKIVEEQRFLYDFEQVAIEPLKRLHQAIEEGME